MEGKGETRLRNEQASENKVESQIPSKKRGKNKKRNYYFFAETGFFRKRVSGISSSDRVTSICSISALRLFRSWS